MRPPRVLLLGLSLGMSLAAASPSVAGEAPAPRIVDRLHAAIDFIDDPFAISADGKRVAWITTDAATHAAVHLATIGEPKSAVEFKYGSITPERVEFLDAERVLIVDRDPETGIAHGEVYGPSGAARDKLGPATDIGITSVGGTPAIVTWLRTASGGKAQTHTLQAFRADNLKPLAKKVFVENGEGRIGFPGGAAKPLYYAGGYAVLVGQMEGAYDKARDVRKPDVEARLDVFSGKLLSETEIKDVVAFATFSLVRQQHQNERNFVRFTDNLKTFELIDEADKKTELHTARPLRKYDPQSLAFQPATDKDGLYVSLSVDPVNAEAVKAQKADKDWLDIYHLDVKAKELSEVVRIDGMKRPTTWRFAGGRLGVLRKHKGFGRGGVDLDIFDLNPEKKLPAASVAPAVAPAPLAGKAPAAVAAPSPAVAAPPAAASPAVAAPPAAASESKKEAAAATPAGDKSAGAKTKRRKK